MKIGICLKFILLVIHLCDNMDADGVSVSSVNNQSEVKEDTAGFYYIVWVTVIGGMEKYRYYSERACTGTLIRGDIVLTLASCLSLQYKDDPDPRITHVHQRHTDTILKALKIYFHPLFYSEDKSVSRLHDFGLIVSERSQQTAYPQLPQRLDNFKDIRNSCVMGGYGTNTNAKLKDNFRLFEMNKTQVDVLEGRGCAGVKICLHFADIMPCEADFGTPLICEGALYALYTPRFNEYRIYPFKCLEFYTTTFTPVYSVTDWMTQITDASTSKLDFFNNPWYVLLLCCVVFVIMGGIYYALVESLQRILDPSEGSPMGVAGRTSLEDDEKDDESVTSGRS